MTGGQAGAVSNGGSVGNSGTGGAMAAAGGSSATGGAQATGGASGTTPPTWTQLYDRYFASSCTTCHANGSGGITFNSAATMCTAIRNAGYISDGSATLETLIRWFNQGGPMPPGGGAAPANAVSDITAWETAGAVCP